MNNAVVPEVEALLKAYCIDVCVFGHLHGEEAERFRPVRKKSIKYVLASADNVDFQPVKIYDKQYIRDKLRNN